MRVSRVALGAGLVLAFGCSWFRPGTRPDDMSAEEHRREAEEHSRWEAEHRRAYDPEARVRVGASPEYGPYSQRARFGYRYSDLYWDVREYNPTEDIATGRSAMGGSPASMRVRPARSRISRSSSARRFPGKRGPCVHSRPRSSPSRTSSAACACTLRKERT